MNAKVVVFDMDGVIINSVPIARTALNKSYPGLTDEIHEQMQLGNFHEELKKQEHLRVPETEEDRKIRHIQYAEAKSRAPLFTGIKKLLQKLHRLGSVLTINTSAYERNCLPMLKEKNIDTYFDFIATSDLSKSKIEKFEIIAKKYKVDIREMLFITDTIGDVREADAMDIPTIAVTWGGGHAPEIFNTEKHENLVGIAHTTAELLSLIEKHML